MTTVLETWKMFTMHEEVQLETPITALFSRSLIEACSAAGRNWFVTLEDPINDPTFGTERGRNDIRFYPPFHHGQTVFFSIECKRLRVATSSGFRDLADKYAEEGIRRFVDGKYSGGLPCAGMVGYVMDNMMSEAFTSVHKEIQNRETLLKLLPGKGVLSPSAGTPNHRWSSDTHHSRSDGDFTIHHVLLGVIPNDRGVVH